VHHHSRSFSYSRETKTKEKEGDEMKMVDIPFRMKQHRNMKHTKKIFRNTRKTKGGRRKVHH